EPHVLDQPWRVWATIAVMGTVLTGILLGALIIPIVQGRGAGLDAFTAICRALGLIPGSPAQPQPTDRTPPTPVSQVVWTPDVLQILARADVERGRGKAQEVCVACHGESGVSSSPAAATPAFRFRPTPRPAPANRGRRPTSSCPTTAPAAGPIR